MALVKQFSGRSFLWIVIMMIFLIAAMDAALFFGIKLVVIKGAAAKAIAEGGQFSETLEQYLMLNTWFLRFFVPASAVIGGVFALIIWLTLRVTLKRIVNKQAETDSATEKELTDSDADKLREKADKRMFIHLLSVLQRDGRLLDFFNEKLDLYEDAQIGAAVRTIHEGCNKTLSKYLGPVPVLDNSEGDTVTIEPGFDPAAIKLTGNVTGNPPFQGVLRHKGWMADTIELPVLSDRENPNIIAPAEVEIE